MGKTGLILRFFDFVKENSDIETIYVDIYPTRSLSDLITALAEAVLRRFPEKTSIGDRFFRFIKGFRPLIGYDALSGQPQIQLNYHSENDKEYTLQRLLQFLDDQKVTIVLAFDEFQQISECPEKNVEAQLRTLIQTLKNMRFIFCGSKKSMMVDMFSSAKRPFYASTRFLSLQKIPNKSYSDIIRNTFTKHNQNIDDEVIDWILDWTRSHTFYTQSLCNSLFSLGQSLVTMEHFRLACMELLKHHEPVYYQYRQLLTKAQWNYLIAVAKEQSVDQRTAQRFISEHRLGTPANSRRISQSLIDKELLLETTTKTETSLQVYDVFFSRWLEREYA